MGLHDLFNETGSICVVSGEWDSLWRCFRWRVIQQCRNDYCGRPRTAMSHEPTSLFMRDVMQVGPAPASSADATNTADDGAARKARVADLVSAVVMPAREALEASLATK